MSLLNAAMALGALAFVVPLAIHLLFRSRFRTMDWGAMFLLRDVVQANRRRMQWHHWILLALRCAIPLLLAIAMARPLVSSMRSMPGSQPISLIMVLDDSRSMSAAQRSSKARGGVMEVLGSLSRKDEVLFIRSSQLNSPAMTGSVQDARDRLRDVRFEAAPVRIDEMVAAAVEACSVASHPFRRIVVCSDFQENTLATNSLKTMETLASRLESITPEVEVDLLNIAEGEQPDALGNVVVEDVAIESPAILVGRRVRMSAVIKNQSEASIPALRCVWKVDGVEVQTERVSLPPRGSLSLRCSHVFDRVGGASVTLAVQYDDALLADNQRRLAVNVMRQVRVWLVDGSPSSQPLQGETDFLKVALSPFAFQATRQPADGRGENRARSRDQTSGEADDVWVRGRVNRDVVSTKMMDAKSFERAFAKLNLPSKTGEDVPDLIVFANVEELPSQGQEEALLSYLRQGGSALVFDGDEVDVEAWRQCSWLPALPEETVELGRSFRIEAPGGRYEPWALLGGAGDSLFDDVEFQRVRKWQLKDEQTSVLMRSEDGMPIVVEQATLGRVVQFAIPCDTAWSNLPLRPVFLPLIQQLVLDLAGSADGLNGPPGSTLVIGSRDGGLQDKGDVDIWRLTNWRVTNPNGQTEMLPVSESGVAQYSNTTQVGVYRFVPISSIDSGKAGVSTSAESESDESQVAEIRVIEVPSEESVLRPVVPEVLQQAVARLGGRSFTDAEDWAASSKQERFGLEIWRPLILLLLVVMIAEVLWQQRGGTKSRLPRQPVPRQPVSSTFPTGVAS